MKCRQLTKQEENEVIIKIIDTLLDPWIVRAGEHRKNQWEKGWSQNLKEGSVEPRYFGKYRVNRLNGKFVMALSKNYERDMLYSIIDSVAKKYLSNSKDIYEFGCGTGHNLLRIKKTNKKANLCGLDWAKSSQKILKKLGIQGYNFDFFHPSDLKLADNSAVVTVAALEQVGTRYKKFVKYLLKNKPSIVIHIEPIEELLDPNNLLDNLSIKYFHKRHYLNGYLTYLRKLEKCGKIKALEARKTGIGSLFIEGYSIVVFKCNTFKDK